MLYLYSHIEFIDFLSKDKELLIICNYELEKDLRLSQLRELECIGTNCTICENDPLVDDIYITIKFIDLSNKEVIKKVERAFFQDIANSNFPLII